MDIREGGIVPAGLGVAEEIDGLHGAASRGKDVPPSHQGRVGRAFKLREGCRLDKGAGPKNAVDDPCAGVVRWESHP
jgi:hypothetical protein